MKKIIIILLISYFKISFSQEVFFNKEITLLYKHNKIKIKPSENSSFWSNKSYFNYLGLKYKYFTKYELINFELNYLFDYLLYADPGEYYSSNQINIPIGYSLYFFKKTWFNPSIGFSINNNFIFNEKIKFSYAVPLPNEHSTVSITEQNEIKFRYQIAFALNVGLSFTIKKRYTLNINGFVNLFSNYKLNPKGEETIPYNIYGYNFGVGYKF